MSLITDKNFEVSDAYKDATPSERKILKDLTGSESLWETDADWMEIPKECFSCGEKLVDLPLIMWAGVKQIWMHVECAKGMSVGILRDVCEHEQGKEFANEFYRKFKTGDFK